MDAADYKKLISQRNVLSHTTLNVTIKELSFRKELALANRLKHILDNNQIPKPEQPDKYFDAATNYYTINLAAEDVEQITDLFFELESSHVTADGDATPTASFYASLADAWHALM